MNREELIDVNKRIKSYEKGAMLLMFLAFLLGVLITSAYYEFYNSRPIPQIVTQTNEVIGLYTSDKFDFPGQWIHVRVDGIPWKQALITCQHEVTHEIVARMGGKNWTKVYELAESLSGGELG